MDNVALQRWRSAQASRETEGREDRCNEDHSRGGPDPRLGGYPNSAIFPDLRPRASNRNSLVNQALRIPTERGTAECERPAPQSARGRRPFANGRLTQAG